MEFAPTIGRRIGILYGLSWFIGGCVFIAQITVMGEDPRGMVWVTTFSWIINVSIMLGIWLDGGRRAFSREMRNVGTLFRWVRDVTFTHGDEETAS